MNNIKLSQPLFDGKFYQGRWVSLSAEGGQQPVKGWRLIQTNSDGTTTEQEIDGAEYGFTMPSCQSLAINALFETSGISDATRLNENQQITDNNWYTLDGRRLNGRPQQHGIYIHGGRKWKGDASK